jgi:hypothetical protein
VDRGYFFNKILISAGEASRTDVFAGSAVVSVHRAQDAIECFT